MIRRFCLYSILKNLRFFEQFFILYLLAPTSVGGSGFTYFQMGLLTGYQKLVTGLLEVPTGFLADHWGRRRGLMVCFGCYAVAFPLFALAAQSPVDLRFSLLMIAQTLFAIGEAFRTGTHKAIMLDWAEHLHPPGGATRVIAVTRFWSKVTSGGAALVGGLMLWQLGSFTPLFWAATIPALLGVALIASYPQWLDGTAQRSTDPPGPRRRGAGLVRLWAIPGMTVLFVQSVLFESQIKLAQIYLQPYLERGLATHDLAVAGGVGAVLIGLYYLIQEGAGGMASWLSVRAETWLGGSATALARIHWLAAGVGGVIVGALTSSWVLVGGLGFMSLALLQNLRRPIFVSWFDHYMDKPKRAATLSMESQGRSFVVAGLAPLTGWVADSAGLAAALAVIVGLLLVAALLGRLAPRSTPAWPQG